MKKYFFLLAALFGFVAISCEEKVDIEKETAAVKAVINGETEAYVNRDTAKMFSYYMKDEYQMRVQANRDTFYIYKGWSDLHSGFQKIDWSAKSNIKYVKEFIEVKIIDEAAWAVYKETQTVETDGVVNKYNLLLTMVLQKVEEKDWKISCFTIYNVTPPAPAPPAEVKK